MIKSSIRSAFCACKDWRTYHRALVAGALERRRQSGSLRVVHLPIA